MTDTQIQPRSATTAGETIHWRSLDQLADTPAFQEIVRREFQAGVDAGPLADGSLADPVSRRKFLGVVAASVALAGMTSCRKPERHILPFNERPPGMTPGIANFYATAFERHGYGMGIVVRSNDGRPTKVEGNPKHPASLGGTDSFAQSEVLNLYDPARSKHVRRNPNGASEPHVDTAHGTADAHDTADAHAAPGEHGGAGHGSLDEFRAFWREHAFALAEKDGAGLRVLMAPSVSPTLQRMVAEALSALPQARFSTWTPMARDAEIAGAKLAFGEAFDTTYDFSNAAVVAAFDSDFLGVDAPSVAWTRSWAASRKIFDRDGDVSRLYAVEPTHSVTGSNAEHRLRVSGAQVGEVVLAVAAALGVGGDAMKGALAKFGKPALGARAERFLAALVGDLRSNQGRACVVVGPRQSAEIQAVGHAINAALGAVGSDGLVRLVRTPPGFAAGDALAGMRELVEAMNAGSVDTLVCLGTNPVYDAPADLAFAAAYAKVPNRVHCGLWLDETALQSTWHLPMAHALEAWGDTISIDGTVSIVQPLIAPLYPDARSNLEIIAELIAEPQAGHDLVQRTWRDRKPGGAAFETFWSGALAEGIAVAAPAGEAPRPRHDAIATALGARQAAGAPTKDSLEVGFRPSPKLLAGEFSNNPWQQELPAPIEKLVWDNAVLMSYGTAKDLEVYNGDVVRLTVDGRSIEGPVWIQPGHAAHCVTLWFGYGRRMSPECEVAAGAGFDVFPLRGSTNPWYAQGGRLEKTGAKVELVTTQEHGVMEGRPLVRDQKLDVFKSSEWKAELESPLGQLAAVRSAHGEHVTERDLLQSLWEERRYDHGYQWGMVIDLNSCTGCSACVVACVAENNIPMVGKEQIARGREMLWDRVDRYFETETGEDATAEADGVPVQDEVRVVHQMVPCMQCQNAPCEAVCPVAATVHSPEGLNDMAYNRCIGTRYCSNNCPYKVRRFNWFNFNQNHPPQRQMQFNPDVTVRARGVMEKCTYCVQRINTAKIRAKIESRLLESNEVQTACQQVCPAEAIVFGNIRDEEARVSQWKQSPLNYAMLSELNVKPRTTYLAKIRNPNQDLT